MITQELVNSILLDWPELNVLYATSDNRLFIRHEEALLHTEGKLDENTIPLTDKTIVEWYEE
jgi:hypothetical protein